MAFNYSINNTPATGAAAMYIVMTTLVAAGWVVKSSSDGTTYNSTGNQITSGNSGTSGLANVDAWFRIQAPLVGSQHREFTFQRPSVNTGWRVKYSPSVGFTGGSPGATQTPSATDEQIIVGSGTDASPTAATLFGTDAAYRFFMIAGDSTVGYGFYWFGNTINSNATNSITSTFLLDIMQTGSYPSADPDPCVIYFATSAAYTSGILTYTNGAKALLNTSYVTVATAGIFFNTTPNSNDIFLPAGFATVFSVTNPFTFGDNLLPVIWGRDGSQTTPVGYKGVSSFIQCPSTVRVTLDTITISTTNDHIVLGNFVFPWGGGVPQI